MFSSTPRTQLLYYLEVSLRRYPKQGQLKEKTHHLWRFKTVAQQDGATSLGQWSTLASWWKVKGEVMGYCRRAGHSRNPGKRCINYLFPPDAECSAFGLNEELGAGGGWGEMAGWVWVKEAGKSWALKGQRWNGASRNGVPPSETVKTINPSLQLEFSFSLSWEKLLLMDHYGPNPELIDSLPANHYCIHRIYKCV